MKKWRRGSSWGLKIWICELSHQWISSGIGRQCWRF